MRFFCSGPFDQLLSVFIWVKTLIVAYHFLMIANALFLYLILERTYARPGHSFIHLMHDVVPVRSAVGSSFAPGFDDDAAGSHRMSAITFVTYTADVAL